MPWTGGVTRTTGTIITAAFWNNHLGASGDLDVLSTHVHAGGAGDGGSSLGPLVLADFTTAVAPAAPGAGKGRFHVVTEDRPGYRAGAAGAAEVLVTRDATETLTAKTLTTPTIGDFTNAGHAHAAVGSGGTLLAANTHGTPSADTHHPESHTTPAMTATVAGHVPTPPNVATQFLNGTGVFSTPAAAVHGAADHTDRTRRWPIIFSHLSVVNAASATTNWTISGTTIDQRISHHLADRASDSLDIVYALIQAPADLVTGTPTFDVVMLYPNVGSSGNYVLKLTVLAVADTTLLTAAGTTTTTGALTVTATAEQAELENITYPISVTASVWQRISLSRAPTNASDTMAGSVSALQSAALVYTADM